MKKIEAIIPTSRVAAVQDALERRDIAEFTLPEVWVMGAEPGDTVLHRGRTYAVDLSPRAKLEVVLRQRIRAAGRVRHHRCGSDRLRR